MLNRVLELTLIIQDVVIKCRIFSKENELLMAENLISFFFLVYGEKLSHRERML